MDAIKAKNDVCIVVAVLTLPAYYSRDPEEGKGVGSLQEAKGARTTTQGSIMR